jgi:hypothetical protein
MSNTRLSNVLLPIGVVLAATIGLLLAAGTNPWDPLKLIIEGSIGWPPFESGSAAKVGDTFMVWVPIALASAGLIVTFNAGMWNIGIEGQIIMGAIAAAWVAREVSAARPVLVALTIIAGAVGGLLWGLLVGVLRTAGGVNEIFGGLAAPTCSPQSRCFRRLPTRGSPYSRSQSPWWRSWESGCCFGELSTVSSSRRSAAIARLLSSWESRPTGTCSAPS